MISLLALVAFSAGARAQGATAYAVWCANNTTLYFLGSTETLKAGDTFTPEGKTEAVSITNVWSGNDVLASPTTKNTAWNATVKGSMTKTVFLPSFRQFKPASLYSWFYYCSKLEEIEGIDNLDTSEATTMSWMFTECKKIASLDLSSWNTGKVTAMRNMFYDCAALTSLTFGTGFTNESLTDMYGTFYKCSALQTLDLSGFKTPAVTTMRFLFQYCSKLQTLTLGTGFTNENLTDVFKAFADCTSLETLNLTDFKTPAVTDMGYLFSGCTALQSVTFAEGMNGNRSTDMSYMFYGCSSLTSVDMSQWTTPTPSSMAYMFQNCKELTSLDLHHFKLNNLQNTSYAFQNCKKLATLTWNTEDESAAISSCDCMFDGCEELASLNLGYLDLSNAYSMNYMFRNCKKLATLTLETSTTGVRGMSYTFQGCEELTTLDLSTFDTRQVTSMNSLFNGCTKLKTIKIGDSWSVSNVTNSYDMFLGCTAIVGQDGITTYDASYVDKTRAHDSQGGYMCTGTSQESYMATPYVVWVADSKTLYFLSSKRVLASGRLFTPPGGDAAVTMTKVWSSDEIPTGESNPGWVSTAASTCEKVVIDASFAGASDPAVPAALISFRNPSTYAWFKNFSKLTTIEGLANLSTSQTFTMGQMFYGCSKLESLDLSSFNTTMVSNMKEMFRDCTALKSITFGENFVTDGVGNMFAMFLNCSSLGNLDLSGFNTAQVANMSSMFKGCSLLQTIDLSGFNTAAVTTMSYMFQNCTKLATIILGDNFTTGEVTDLSWMFNNCKALTAFNHPAFIGSKVTTVAQMFSGCTTLENVNLAGSDLSSLVVASSMFSGCTVLKGFDTSVLSTATRLNTMEGMFQNCPALTTLDLSMLNSTSSVSFKNAFSGCSNLERINFGTASITPHWDMSYMFYNCAKLKSLDFSHFDTKYANNLAYAFSGCTSLESINLTGFKTNGTSGNVGVSSMGYMFYNCSSLTDLDLSSFNTSPLETTTSMFEGCSSLVNIYISDTWTVAGVTSHGNMFKGCNSIVGQDGVTTYDASRVNKNYAHDEAGGYMKTGTSTPGPMTPYMVYCAENKTAYFFQSTRQLVRGRKFIPEGSEEELLMTEVDNGMNGCNDYYTVCSNLEKVIFMPSFADVRPTSTQNWFNQCVKLTTIEGMENLNTSEVTNMSQMFCNCTSLADIDLSHFDTQKVTNMSNLFMGCSALGSLDLSNFQTVNVTNMSGMFYNCATLSALDLSPFLTNNVTNMRSMFQGCSNLETIYVSGGWTTDGITSNYNSGYMFADCVKLSGKDEGGIAFNSSSADKTHAHTGADGYLSSGSQVEIAPTPYAVWCADNTTVYFLVSTTTIGGTFTPEGSTTPVNVTKAWYGKVFNDTYSSAWRNYTDEAMTRAVFETSFSQYHPVSLNYWFDGCKELQSVEGTANLNTSETTAMSFMFRGCSKLTTVDMSQWNTAGVTIMYHMFQDCTSLQSLDLSALDTGGVTEMQYMFQNCSALTSLNLGGTFTTESVTSMFAMFYGCSSLQTLGLSMFNTEKVKDMGSMFYGCSSLQSLDLSGFDTASLRDTHYMFGGCKQLATLTLGTDFNTSGVTDMSNMFRDCESLTALSLEHFDTGNVTDMSNMFNGCKSLTTLDLSTFNTGREPNTRSMFNGCTLLKSIFVSSTWGVTENMSSVGMFEGCTSIVGEDNTTYDATEVDGDKAHYLAGGYLRHSSDQVIDPTPFAVYCDDTKTLYFLQSTTPIVSGGAFTFTGTGKPYLATKVASGLQVTAAVASDSESGMPLWNTTTSRQNLTTVIFEPSFASVTPTSMRRWFSGLTSLTDIQGWEYLNTSEVTDMSLLFNNCKLLTHIDLSHFDTRNVTVMNHLFSSCAALKNIDLSPLDTRSVTNMDYMFSFTGLEAIDASRLNTSAVTSMSRMFASNSQLATIDISGFDTGNVQDMEIMFGINPLLESIYIGDGWDVGSVAKSTEMFRECPMLKGEDGTMVGAVTDKTYAHANAGGYLRKQQILLGDVNGDGKVTPADAIMILYHYFGVVQTDFIEAAADVNGDGKVTPADAIGALYIYFGATAGARSSSPAKDTTVAPRDPE